MRRYPLPDLPGLRGRYAAAKQLEESCRAHGFSIEGLIDGNTDDVEAAERLLAFLSHVEGTWAAGHPVEE